MSKLKLDKINFDDDDFLVEVLNENKVEKRKIEETSKEDIEAQKELQQKIQQAKKIEQEADLILNQAKNEAQNIIETAQQEAKNIKEHTLSQAEEKSAEIIENANLEASKIIEEAKANCEVDIAQIVEKTKQDLEQERIKTIKEAYEEGHKDGLEKIQEELEDKISDFDKFFKSQYELRDKILKSANKDILDLILNISKKVLLSEVNAVILDKIIKNAITLLEKKENINIIVSEKYAKLLFEHQKKSLDDDIEFNFEEFNQYENFNIVFNPDFDDDTIIIENLKERYDASLGAQLDVIIRNIYDNSQNGKLDLEQYENEAE